MATAQAVPDESLLKLWIAHDAQSKRVLDVARKVAGTRATILIRGESGTGKDRLAQLIHLLSPARDEPFLKIDCASLPSELIESELFGHERGAFTGANPRQVRAITDEVEQRLKQRGLRAHHVEGYNQAEWVLMDYVDFVVHIFSEKARAFYDLERLWRTADRLPVEGSA